MSAINDTLNSAGSILNDAVRFGIGLGGAILVAGILFDLGEYNIVTNVTATATAIKLNQDQQQTLQQTIQNEIRNNC